MASKAPRLSLALLEFFGSMKLAIMMLCIVAIASIIGTVFQQNQPYQDYLIRFGPFWFEIFKWLGLYDVYAAPWFLAVMGLMVTSTSVCIYRNTPGMWREVKSWKDHLQRRAMVSMAHHHIIHTQVSPDKASREAGKILALAKYQSRKKTVDGAELLSAKRGMLNRLGYLLTHLGIVIICVGGVIDSSFHLTLREKFSDLRVETRNIPATEIPIESWLEPNPWSFRGNVNLPEQQRADLVFLRLRDGYVVQRLPFDIELKDFRTEHYSTGQPKSFESDLVIHDENLDHPLEATISVNHPLEYKGHTIYQASFNDGGSKLSLKTWPLFGPNRHPQEIHSEVFDETVLTYPDGSLYRLELTDFRLFNIKPNTNPDIDKKFINHGPNYTYRLRDPSGQAKEYETFMSPVEFEGRYYFTTGVRSSPAEPFLYMHIPADEAFSLKRFFKFVETLQAPGVILSSAQEAVLNNPALGAAGGQSSSEVLAQSMTNLANQFIYGGYEAVIKAMESSVPEARRRDVFEAYLKVLDALLGEVYKGLFPEGHEISKDEWVFFDDAKDAINAMSQYGSPYYLQLINFTHIQASGLQITKSPAKFWVYLGCLMLSVGIFMLFYINRRRVWVWIEQQESRTEILISGQSHRKTDGFEQEFKQICLHIDRAVKQADSL